LPTIRRFAEPALRNNNRAVLVPAFEAILRTQPAAHWLAVFDAAGIPAEPINTLRKFSITRRSADRGMLIEVEYPAGSGNRIRTAGMPWRAVAAEGPVLSPPGLGQHTEEVLSELHLRSSVLMTRTGCVPT